MGNGEIKRNPDRPDNWPFGALDELQLQRHLKQQAMLRNIEARKLRERAAAARTAILSQLPEALL